MSNLSTRVFTKTFTAPFTITNQDHVSQLSILVSTGTCNIEGDYKFQGQDSDVIALAAGQGITLPGSNGAPLDGITVTPTGNTVVTMLFN